MKDFFYHQLIDLTSPDKSRILLWSLWANEDNKVSFSHILLFNVSHRMCTRQLDCLRSNAHGPMWVEFNCKLEFTWNSGIDTGRIWPIGDLRVRNVAPWVSLMDDDIHGWHTVVTWLLPSLFAGSVNASLVVDDRFMVHNKVSYFVLALLYVLLIFI